MSVAPQPHPTQSMPMPPMLAYTVASTPWTNNNPYVVVDVGSKKTNLHPANGQDDSRWIVMIDANNPRTKVKEWVIPAAGRVVPFWIVIIYANNPRTKDTEWLIPAAGATVPAGIGTFMDDQKYIFAVCTQYL